MVGKTQRIDYRDAVPLTDDVADRVTELSLSFSSTYDWGFRGFGQTVLFDTDDGDTCAIAAHESGMSFFVPGHGDVSGRFDDIRESMSWRILDESVIIQREGDSLADAEVIESEEDFADSVAVEQLTMELRSHDHDSRYYPRPEADDEFLTHGDRATEEARDNRTTE